MIRTRQGQGTTLVEYWADETGPASGLESLPLTMHFGGARLPIAGIASVYTEDAHRNRGYARKCVEHALELQCKEGALLSFLFAIPCFYEPFGYTVVMPWYGIYVPLRSWTRLPDEPFLREVSAQDESAMRDLYESAVGFRIGPLARDAVTGIQPAKPVRWRTSAMTRVLPGRADSVRGYVCHSEPGAADFEIAEVGAQDDAAREAILAYILHETSRRGKDQFIAALPPDDPFALYLRRHDARFVINTRPSGGGMARILSLQALCKGLEPVLARRVGAADSALVPSLLLVSTETGDAMLALPGSATAARIEVSLAVLTKLFFGYLSFAESVSAGAIHSLRPEIGELLFPSAHPFIYLKDRF
jgi:predicted acetyltransferase